MSSWRARSEDLGRAGELWRQGSSDIWWVCDDYVLRGGQIKAAYPEFLLEHEGSFPGPGTTIEHWWCYKPLDDAPELFLKLAQLSEAPDFDEAALAFCQKYGVPASARDRMPGTNGDNLLAYTHVTDLAEFADDSEKAMNLLRTYEAVINGDAAKADFLLRGYYDADFFSPEEEPGKYSKWDPAKLALECVKSRVEEVVQEQCWPYLEIREAVEPPRVDPSKVYAGWSFDDLLGAAYLQMYWLIASANELRRCEYCGTLIPLAHHQPRKRKSRNDKRFCNDACRQANYRSKQRAQDVPA